MIKEHVPIVHRGITILRANVTYRDSFARLVCLLFSNLYNERGWPMVVILGRIPLLRQKQLCYNDLSNVSLGRT